ncbi:MAG: ABC transporter substrate-binding protein [Phycisphaera sp.]|nr:ABC transporter substrate-binding protein [Phycisphaera sp.]
MNRPRLRLSPMPAAIIAIAVLLIQGCGGSGADPDDSGNRRLSVQLNWFPEPEFGGLYAARENGHFESQGLEVELVKGGADVPAGQLVASGSVEIAVVSAAQLATLRAQGGRATAVFASFQKAPRAAVVMADSKYESLEALWAGEGRIMADAGLPWTRWVNRKYGDTKLRFVPYAGSFAAFLSGDVVAMQAFATAEPVQLEADGESVRTFLAADTGYNPYDVVLAVHDDFLEREPETVRGFVTALTRGWEDYLENPASTNAVIAKLNPDFTAATLELAASRLPAFVRSPDTEAHRLGWMSDERWSTLLDQLVAIGELKAEDKASIGRLHVNPEIDSESSEGVPGPDGTSMND